jgi:hypothetical protein
MPMAMERCSSSIMSVSERSPLSIPVIVTSFRDFELEERVVRILAGQGFVIGERKIVTPTPIKLDEILITDSQVMDLDLPFIAIPLVAREWSDQILHSFLQSQLFPPLNDGLQGMVIVLGSDSWRQRQEEIVATMNSHALSSIIAPFDERDIRSALIPTRRREERIRFANFAYARFALFLLGTERHELAQAHSLIEYRRRVHPHLQLGFVLIGGRKAIRSEISTVLEPFPIFRIDDERDQLVKFNSRKKRQRESKFQPIVEWIGSHHGDSGKSRDLSDRVTE